jgi:hypothetical protein
VIVRKKKNVSLNVIINENGEGGAGGKKTKEKLGM